MEGLVCNCNWCNGELKTATALTSIANSLQMMYERITKLEQHMDSMVGLYERITKLEQHVNSILGYTVVKAEMIEEVAPNLVPINAEKLQPKNASPTPE